MTKWFPNLVWFWFVFWVIYELFITLFVLLLNFEWILSSKRKKFMDLIGIHPFFCNSWKTQSCEVPSFFFSHGHHIQPRIWCCSYQPDWLTNSGDRSSSLWSSVNIGWAISEPDHFGSVGGSRSSPTQNDPCTPLPSIVKMPKRLDCATHFWQMRTVNRHDA